MHSFLCATFHVLLLLLHVLFRLDRLYFLVCRCVPAAIRLRALAGAFGSHIHHVLVSLLENALFVLTAPVVLFRCRLAASRSSGFDGKWWDPTCMIIVTPA